jgi:MarR family transcriptional regulator, organic hydroperoxide resistance regulator
MPNRQVASRSRHPADPRKLQRLDHQLCFALYSSSLVMTKLYKQALARLGITYPQYLALLVLWETDALGVGELGARLYLDSGTLTPLLKRLESAGLVSRTRVVGDERRVLVTLTPAGRALRRKAEGVPMQIACASGYALNELSELTAQLQTLRANVVAHRVPAAA